jgi:tetraacyldisaccharide 4'-kinase
VTDWSLPFARAAARMYGGAASLRRELRQRAALKLQQPVISVGNLAVGGRNKTPVVAAIARLLRSWGERPAVLSRGYRRRTPSRDVVVVRDAEHLRATVDESGDEPFMLARELPGCCVLVHPQRYVAGAFAEQSLDCTIHVLDDGFQHVQLARDVNLVLVTLDDVLHGEVLPAGRLREPVEALRHADAILAVDASAAQLFLALGCGDEQPVFEVHRHLGHPRPISGVADFSRLQDMPVLLLTAIAAPERVMNDLRAAGWQVADHLAFADHHHFTAADIATITARVAACGAAAVVTTAKDAVKLERWLPIDVPVAVIPLDVVIEPADRFAAWLRDRLSFEPEGA